MFKWMKPFNCEWGYYFCILAILGLILILCMISAQVFPVTYEVGEVTSGSVTLIENSSPTSPTLQFVINKDGSIRQLDDIPTTSGVRKFAVVTKTQLQIESVTEEVAESLLINSRKWQLSLNGSLLIKQMGVNPDTGLPDFDNASYWVLSGTSDTLVSVNIIRAGFTHYPIENPEIIE